MSYAANAQKLETASERLMELVSQLRDTAQAGQDSIEYASKMKVLGAQAALAETGFWEALSAVHCDNLNIQGETPCENADDFAQWAKCVAHTRSIAPFEGIRSPAKWVDLRPMLAAE